MKVLLITPGKGPWPNDGWGACENICADFGWALRQAGADVKIFHSPTVEKDIDSAIQLWNPDVVHNEYDDHTIHLLHLADKYPKIQFLVTTHYAFLSQPTKLVQDGYMRIFLETCQATRHSNIMLMPLSEAIASTYKTLGNVDSKKLWIFPNGTRTDLIQCSEKPEFPTKAICVGKIETRKCQKRLQVCPAIDFVGPIHDTTFSKTDTYKGHWKRAELYSNLTRYACVVLMSCAEAHPLVLGEALAAGCAVLCSEVAAANLPTVPWIRVAPMSLLDTPAALSAAVAEMCAIGCARRAEIRSWACENLDWRLRTKTYLDKWTPAVQKSLNIVLIGPGIMPIPPTGWGAVEQLIWDYTVTLRALGHTVDLINIPDRVEIIKQVNDGNYDVAHLHYDVFHDILPYIRAKKIAVTSHYPYVDKKESWDPGYVDLFNGMCHAVRNHGAFIYALSVKDRKAFIEFGGLPPERIVLMPNGVNTDSFQLKPNPKMGERSVTLAKVEVRKRQHLTYWLPQVDYIGRGPFNHPNYRGELEPRERLLEILPEYGNFVLLSDGENGTPLVVKEAMAAGLGCVLSESAANELPSLPWVTVIPEADLGNTKKLHEAIENNRKVALELRPQIREWIRVNWDWSHLVNQYISNLKS